MGYRNGSKHGEGFNSPGPGQYNPKVEYAKENIGGIKIGTGTRDSRGLTGGKDVPGPGQYNAGGNLGGPAFGIGTGSRT
jgi:hypothetical protein